MFLFLVLDWGSANFAHVVPNGHTNYERFLTSAPTRKSVSFQDNSNVHVRSGSNLVSYVSRDEKMLSLRRNEAARRLHDPSKYYMNGDGVTGSLQVRER